MYAIDDFDIDALVSCRQALHELAAGARSMEVVAQRIVHHLHQGFRTASGAHACALVRIYKTHRFSMLPAICSTSSVFEASSKGTRPA